MKPALAVALAVAAALLGVAVGLAVAWVRVRHHRRELARARDEARTVAEGARLLGSLRHRLATPLQTLEVSTAVLRRRCTESATALERMDAALARLRELTGLLPASGGPPGRRDDRRERPRRDAPRSEPPPP